jgi:hypothetical protein
MTTQTHTGSQSGTQNLWEKALATLDPDLQTVIDYKFAGKRDVAAAALRTAKEKRDICLRKRWRYKKANGRELIIRDVLDKIVGFLDKFVAVGDAAVQYDPTHASLPWSGVRFLLRAAVSDQHAFGGTIESLETVSRLITQYAIFEHLYYSKPSSIRSEMEAALVALYAEILKQLAKAKLYFQKSTAGTLSA